MSVSWQIHPFSSSENIHKLAADLDIPTEISTLFVQRNILTKSEALDFIEPDISQLHSPLLMKDMDLAAQRVIKAITLNEKIVFFGDNDVDGTTGVTLLFKAFNELLPNNAIIISNRQTEGIGLNESVLKRIFKFEPNLIITVDCGTSSRKEISELKSKGIDTIVCDHHNVPDETPQSYAFLNPKRHDCAYPFKDLSGCAIAYKLVHAVYNELNIAIDRDSELYQLVSLSIISDFVAIQNENRILAAIGLDLMNRKPLPFIVSITNEFAKKRVISPKTIQYSIAPRLNAPGRIDDAMKSVKLMLCQSILESDRVLKVVNEINSERRNLVYKAMREADEMLKNNPELLLNNIILLKSENWNSGIAGVISANLVEKYKKPVGVFSINDTVTKGSLRSTKGVKLFNLVDELSDHLIEFGGHQYAVGVVLKTINIDEFFTQLINSSSIINLEVDDTQIEYVDAELQFNQITSRLTRFVKMFEPYGYKNNKPIFMSRNLSIKSEPIVLQNKHIKIKLCQHEIEFEAIAFNKMNLLTILMNKSEFSAVFHVVEKRWSNKQEIQLEIVDVF